MYLTESFRPCVVVIVVSVLPCPAVTPVPQPLTATSRPALTSSFTVVSLSYKSAHHGEYYSAQLCSEKHNSQNA